MSDLLENTVSIDWGPRIPIVDYEAEDGDNDLADSLNNPIVNCVRTAIGYGFCITFAQPQKVPTEGTHKFIIDTPADAMVVRREFSAVVGRGIWSKWRKGKNNLCGMINSRGVYISETANCRDLMAKRRGVT